MGHNLSLNHDRWAVVNVPKGGGTLNDPHPWSHGYVSDTCQWRTIMAYYDKCGTAFIPSLVNFSDPARSHRGEPMGVPGDGRTRVLDGPADNVRTLNAVRRQVHLRRRWPSGNNCDISGGFNFSSLPSTSLKTKPFSFWAPDCRSKRWPSRLARYFTIRVKRNVEHITITLDKSQRGAVLALRLGTATEGATLFERSSTMPNGVVRYQLGLGRGTYTIEAASGDSPGGFRLSVGDRRQFDLDVQTLRTNVETPLAGQSFRLSATVRNEGPGSSPRASLHYWRKPLGGTRSVIVGVDAVESLAASRTSAQQIALVAPSSAGVYEYRACVQANSHSHLESYTPDNCSSPLRVTVAAVVADLVVRPPRVSDDTLTPGQSFTLSMHIRNQGRVASRTTVIRFYRSSDSGISASDTVVGQAQVRAIGANSGFDVSTNLSAPSAPGTYYYGGCVAPVLDSNMSNNCSVGRAVNVGGGTTDRDVLVALYNATGGPGWTNKRKWVTEEPIATWDGVHTDGSGRVVGLDVRRNGLTGQIPPEFGALARLDWVYFSQNALTGQIPAELATLANLRLLELSSNQFSGEIPAGLGELRNLENLYLHGNQLTGWIPPELGSLTELEQLVLNNNQLVGAVPSEVGGLSKLQDLHLDANQLEGPIPAELGDLAQLETLSLDADTGLCLGTNLAVNTTFGRLAQAAGLLVCGETGGEADRAVLEALYAATGGPGWTVNTNWLSEAPISEWAGVETDGRGRVMRLDLDTDNGGDLAGSGYGNNLRGPIPPELGRLSNIVRLLLGGNELTGAIPAALGGLVNLELLQLHFNQLSGAIPAELGNLTKVTNLQLDGDTGLCLASDFRLDSQFAQLAMAAHNGVAVCRGSGPDLTVESPAASDVALTTGESFEWTATVRNQGAERAGATRVRLYRSVDPVISRSDLEVVYSPVASLGPGATGLQSISLPAPLNAGTYYYGGCVDGVSGESDTTNNCSVGVGVAVSRPANRPPEPVSSLAPLTIGVDDAAASVEVSGAFRDPDGDALTYGTSSSATSIAWVTASESTVTVTPLAEGALTVTVLATDVAGSNTTATQTLEVTVTPSADAADRAALEAFYDATGGAGWTDSTNWKTEAPLGEWYGVRTDGSGRVAGLGLGANGLAGSIPGELGSLANLDSLELFGNALRGPIPAELGNLANLTWLVLGANALTGLIPPELGGLVGLEYLDLAGNALTGPIPAELGGLANLRGLYLHVNELSGPIPPELGNLSRLEVLGLTENRLSGPIPSELASLVNLKWLGLAANDLSGPVPGELGHLVDLEQLHLYENALSGPLPSPMMNLSQLEALWIYSNAGLCVPAEAAFQAWLATIEDFRGDTCAANRGPQQVGAIPAQTLGEGDGAATLDVAAYFQDPDGDPLTYTAVSSAAGIVTAAVSGSTVTLTPVSAGTATVTVTARDPAGLSATQTIAVTVSSSSAVVTDRAALVALYDATGGPTWRASFNWNSDRPLSEWHGVEVDAAGRVTELRLFVNNLRGQIPPELGNLTNLKVLDFATNALSGPIPGELGSLISLELLNLAENTLSGPVPGELGNVVGLRELILNKNTLSGPIPGELGNLGSLRILDLWSNALSGPIPDALGNLASLEVLELGNNALSGPIPVSLGSLANLTDLWLEENDLSGAIPAELGNLANLEDLALHENSLSGPIPAELGSLGNLERLWLFANDLSGPIPAELGSLGNLASLRLSENDLSGPIPAELGSLGNLFWLGLYSNELSGPLPSSMTNLRQLELLYISDNAGLCAPADAGFQAWLAAIDDFVGDTCGANRAPQAVGAIPAQTLREGDAASTVNVAAYFRDLDGDPLTYTAVSSNRGIVTAAVSGITVTLTPVSAGAAAVTVTARDPSGLSAAQAIAVTVTSSNRPPEPVGTLAPLTIAVDEAPVTVEVAGAFRDPDSDRLSYGASSSAPAVVAVGVAGSRVTVTPVSAGTAVVTVTAADTGGSNTTATQTFTVTVPRAFTDHPIVAGVTPVRAVHFTELRTRIDGVRAAVGLGRYPWTDRVLSAGVTRVRLVHLLELRRALDEAYVAAARPAPSWTDALARAGSTPIRAAHLMELRAAVVVLE